MTIYSKLLKVIPMFFSFTLCLSCNTKGYKNVYCPNKELGQDCLISQGYPNRNYSTLDALNLLVLTRNDTVENDSRFLIKFSFNSLPLNSVVDSAFIYLKAKEPGHFGVNNTFKAEQVIEDWDRKTVNWTTQPKTNVLAPIIINAPKNSLEDFKINAMAYVTSVKSKTIENHGLLFKFQNEEPPFKGVRFHSSNAKEEINRPKLVVYFH